MNRKMLTLDRLKPSMARLMTREPKCAQLPTANTRISAICKAITAPATKPNEIYAVRLALNWDAIFVDGVGPMMGLCWPVG